MIRATRPTAEDVQNQLDELEGVFESSGVRSIEPLTYFEHRGEAERLMGASVLMLRTALALSTASIGECRKGRPYGEVRVVIDENGELKYCCNHDPEHCVP